MSQPPSAAMMLVLGLFCSLLGASARAQSNYDMQGNSIEYNKEQGLPDSTILDGKVTKLDDISPHILLNRTKATLNCASGAMQIELKFDEPFVGIVYADFNRASACQVTGRGDLTAKLTLPLKGCGTKQDPQRVFTNNIVVRFHPALEMDGDEVITIVCRYPPPVAPPPAANPPNYIKDDAVVSPIAPPLQGFQILLIICGILFLSLVLLGLGCSYYLLRRKRFQVVRRHPLSTGTGSEITKLSGSTLGNISMFEGLKIPRAHAALAAGAAGGGSVSGSEAALISGADTLPSDYPSESPSSAHSEVEDTDTRSLRRSVSSAGSYDNKAFVHDSTLAAAAAAATASGYYEEYHRSQTKEVISAAGKRPPPEPKFDVQVRVKKAAPPPPPTPTPPPSESEMSMKMAERNLTTILEREEDLRSSFHQAKTSFSYVPDLEPQPKMATPPPPVVYSTVQRRHHDEFRSHDVVDTMETRAPPSSVGTDLTETEMVEVSPTKYSPPPPPVVPQSLHQRYTTTELHETTTDLIEPPVVVSRRPEIKSHVVDDVFLRTITEKRTIEDIERTRRKVTDYKKSQAPPPPPAKWDVTIRNYPGPRGAPSEDTATDWESYSETSSMSAFPPPPPPDRYSSEYDRREETRRRLAEYRSSYIDEEAEEVYRSTIQEADPKVQNWDVLVRVLEPPIQPDTPDDISDVTSIVDTASTLTVEDRKRWRDIITKESTLRTMLTEATVREDYERIRRDERYEKLFDPDKWDVIIRVLAPPHQYDQKSTGSGSNKYKKKSSSDWETRSSRRSSLPTLYEYDSDGGSSVRTLTASGGHGGLSVGPVRPARWRRASGSSIGDGSETTTDYGGESYYRSAMRTTAAPRGSGYYQDELREVMVRSRSQPTLLDDDGPLEHRAVGGVHGDHHQWGGAYTLMRQSYTQSTTQQQRSQHMMGPGGSQVRRWFPDNTDSEASYK